MTGDSDRGQYGPPSNSGQPPNLGHPPNHGHPSNQGHPQNPGQLPAPQQWAGPASPYQYPDHQQSQQQQQPPQSSAHPYPYPYPYPAPGAQQHDMHQPPLQPQHPDPFRSLPPPPVGYPYPPHMDPYRHAPPQQYQAPAPRQRTAIACRYCRRRKIRCSGYEGENGKCSNCIRFSQECLFTPVSSNAQAFVPAHVAFPALRNQAGGAQGGRPPQLYGAHGQPLPPDYGTAAAPEGGSSYPPPPSTSAAYLQYSQSSNGYDGYGNQGGPGYEASGNDRREPVTSSYAYPDPTGQNLAPVSPATSTSNYSNPAGSTYYPSAPPSQRRTSPQSTHSFDRTSDSPRGAAATLPPSTQGQPAPGRTPPPPSAAPGSRPGMSVAGLLGGSSPGDASRSTHDNDMLNALGRGNRGSGDERK